MLALQSRLDVVCFALLGLMLAVFGVQGLFEADGSLREIQDYVITWSYSDRLVKNGAYHRDFNYPLPAVVFKLLFAAPGLVASSILWMGLMLFSGLACARAMISLLGQGGRRTGWLVPFVAFLSTYWYVQWDFRAVNSNTVFLALVLGALVADRRDRPWLAGWLLATSIALKLYSAPLLGLLVVRGRGQTLGATVAGCFIYFVLVPAAYFGPATGLQLTQSWVATVAATSDPEYVLELIANKVSLLHVLLQLFGEPGAGQPGNVLALPLATVHSVMRVAQGVWVAGVVSFLVWARRRPCVLGAGASLLADAALVLLSSLLLSALLQPHHGTLLWAAAAVLCAAVLAPTGVPGSLRIAFVAVLLCGAVALKLADSSTYKGLVMNLMIVAYCASLVWLRVACSVEADEEPSAASDKEPSAAPGQEPAATAVPSA